MYTTSCHGGKEDEKEKRLKEIQQGDNVSISDDVRNNPKKL
jgi:ABC-type metal ion transport system substrate-binding protein